MVAAINKNKIKKKNKKITIILPVFGNGTGAPQFNWDNPVFVLLPVKVVKLTFKWLHAMTGVHK